MYNFSFAGLVLRHSAPHFEPNSRRHCESSGETQRRASLRPQSKEMKILNIVSSISNLSNSLIVEFIVTRLCQYAIGFKLAF